MFSGVFPAVHHHALSAPAQQLLLSMRTALITALGRATQLTRHLQHTAAGMATSEAPWRSTLLSHIQQMDQPSFVLSTLHPVEGESASASAAVAFPSSELRFAPRARYVIYRGMWACLPVNPKNTAELNPDLYQSDMPTIVTDIRMEKVPELLASGSEGGASEKANGKRLQSGKGGPVEAVFWISKVSTQWRVRGHAYVIGPDIDSEAAAPVRTSLQTHMRPISGEESGEKKAWSWSRELTAHFGNLSPTMRGSFKNPPPGTPLSQGSGEGLALGQKVQGVDDETARSNFAVVVIVPEQVDQVDLTDPERGRRWNYKLSGADEEKTWKVTECWP